MNEHVAKARRLNAVRSALSHCTHSAIAALCNLARKAELPIIRNRDRDTAKSAKRVTKYRAEAACLQADGTGLVFLVLNFFRPMPINREVVSIVGLTVAVAWRHVEIAGTQKCWCSI